MTASNHDRSALARLWLAAGGAAVLVAVASAACLVAGLIGGPRGTLAGVILVGVVSGGCGLVSRGWPQHLPDLPRPAVTPLAEPVTDLRQPAGTLT